MTHVIKGCYSKYTTLKTQYKKAQNPFLKNGLKTLQQQRSTDGKDEKELHDSRRQGTHTETTVTPPGTMQWPVSRTPTSPKAGDHVELETQQLPISASRNAKYTNSETAQRSLPDETHVTTLSSSHTPRSSPYKLKMYVHTETCPWMVTAATWATVKTGKQPRCPSVGGGRSKLWYIQTLEYYSALTINYREKTFKNVNTYY